MADRPITASQVQPGAGAVFKHGVAAEAITAGQTLYKLADATIGLAENDVAGKTNCVGIAVCSCAAGQIVEYQTEGTIIVGADAGIGEGDCYVVSSTAGGIILENDAGVGTGDTITYLGIGNDSDGIVLQIFNSDVVHV